jgi:hypothetical protein
LEGVLVNVEAVARANVGQGENLEVYPAVVDAFKCGCREGIIVDAVHE